MFLHSTHPGNSRKPLRRCAVRLAATLLTVALVGCQSLTMNSAQLRVIDTSADSGLIDSYQNNSALAYNLGFGTMTTYVPMSPGTYTLAADRVGTRQTLAESSARFVTGKQYTEIIGNNLVNLQQTILLDQSVPAPSGQIAVRLIHQATHSGAVDVYLVPTGGRSPNLSPIVTNLSFGANSGYINVPEGTYAIDVVPTGTVLASSTVTLLNGAQTSYASGAVRTVVLIDQEIVGNHQAALPPGLQSIIADDADAQ